MKHPRLVERLRRHLVRTAPPVAAAILLSAVPLHAQRTSEFTLDLRPFGGSVGFAQRVTDGVFLGLSAGGGVDALDRTFAPDPSAEAYRAFEQIVHVNAFLRQKPARWADVDLGLRLGIGGVRECTASDCWPGAFVGMTAGAFFGSRTIKVGPRVLWALARESGQSNPVFWAELLTVRLSF